MNRTIKFRAWDKVNDEWADGLFWMEQVHVHYLLTAKPSVLEMFHEDFELMQYTGLKDKHRKEIYEDDIVKAKISGVGQNLLVGWNAVFSQWRLYEGAGVTKNLPITDIIDIEVIGNRFENPELLEGKQ